MTRKNNIVLLGDSTLDNGSYTGGEPSVTEYLREKAGPDCQVTLLAVDSGRIQDVYGQLKTIPADATCLVLSVGGNDALGYGYILEDDSKGFHPVLTELGKIYRDFKIEYTDAIISCAVEELLPVIDLRGVCFEPEHFTQQIEPSGPGGKRIADAIWNALNLHDFDAEGVRIYC